MKLTDKTKRYLTIGGGAVICIGLIAAISLQFGKMPAGEDTLPEESSAVTEIVVDPGEVQIEESDSAADLVIKPETGTETEETAYPVDSRPAQTDQTEQSIQPDVTKPEEPSEDVLTDPTQMQDGTKVEKPSTPVAHEDVVMPQEATPKQGEPAGGETHTGQN